MRGRFKGKGKITRMQRNLDGNYRGAEDAPSGRHSSPVPGESVASSGGPNSPVAGETLAYRSSARDASTQSAEAGLKRPGPDAEKKYLGVRVKMPVRDMLRSIRLAKGLDPAEAQGAKGKACKEKRRVNTHGDRRNSKRRQRTKSLEELAIIVEVLEEDLKTRLIYSPPPQPISPDYSPSHQSVSSDVGPPPPVSPDYCSSPQPLSPTYSSNPRESPWSPEHPCSHPQQIHYYPPPSSLDAADRYRPPAPPLSSVGEGSSDESDDMMSSPGSHMSCSPGINEYQVPSPPAEGGFTSPRAPSYPWGESQEWAGYQNQTQNQAQAESWDSSAFFWTQLQREENLLREVSDTDLLATDQNGKTALHRAVIQGRRPLGYVIAKRMSALDMLDVKDSEGKTALHLAAQKNQHMMVADLVRLGADINERDRSGKTCLHLSAENGYIRVLEVLKNMMNDGVYVDVGATDNCGLSVLQCAAVSLNLVVRELERSVTPSQTRLHTLRKEQMMETLECLLLMDSHLHTRGGFT